LGIAGVLALLAALVFALSTVLQQRGTFQVPDMSLRHPGSLVRLVTRPVWLLSLVVMALGWGLQAAALDRGRVAIVQTFLTMTLVFVLPLGWWLTAQKVTRREVAAAFAIVAGLAIFAVVGNPANGVSDAPSADWFVATGVVTLFCAGVLWVGDRRGPTIEAAANGAVSGASAGLTAVMAKPLLTELHRGLSTVLSDPKLYVFIVYGAPGCGVPAVWAGDRPPCADGRRRIRDVPDRQRPARSCDPGGIAATADLARARGQRRSRPGLRGGGGDRIRRAGIGGPSCQPTTGVTTPR
jgi:drug/metabolite transporter (DMT)-like permease